MLKRLAIVLLALVAAWQVWAAVVVPTMSWPPVNTSIGAQRWAQVITGVTFGTTGDYPNASPGLPIVLPPGYTRYVVGSVRISNCSATIAGTPAVFGVFTAAAAGGNTVLGSTNATISSSTDGASSNYQSVAPTAISYTLSGFPNLFFHISTAQAAGSPTCDVMFDLVGAP